MLKMVPLVSARSSGGECENVAVLEFVQERLSNNSWSSVKYAMSRGYEYHEISELSRTAFKQL